jgi:nucleotide-binding universal stress UspA family protein
MMRYSEQPPPHGHRSPSELVEDDLPPTRRPLRKQTPAATLPSDFHYLASGQPFNLLLAIENDNNALVAIQVANELTLRGAMPRVVNVTRSLSAPYASPSAQSYVDEILGEDFRSNRCRLLHDLISDAVGESRDWPVESVIGDPATRILEAAASDDAELIVIGINHHGLMAQAMGQNTATRVMGRASVPVLGVRPGMPNRQKLIMVATDFGQSSRQAAHIAANLLEPHGRLVLVYVTPTSELADVAAEDPEPMRDQEVDDACRRIAADIRATKPIDVASLHRIGDPVEELLAAAEIIAPDLIAIGSERVDRPSRLPLDSLTRALILDGRWPMLVTPPLNFKEEE